jgi:Protein of unknown function DUF262
MMGVQSYRIAKLISEVEGKRLEVKPFFQRRQVWTNTDKEFFIDTILKEYPFPEIFIATGAFDRKEMKLREWLVDGQQRVTTIIDYFRGSPYLLYKTIKPFDQLTPDEQNTFLEYEVAVRDLGTVTKETVREIFRRINSTDYALKSMEVLNAMFSGEYKRYCEALSRQPFFVDHKVFPEAYQKRMYDVTFCVILVTTLLAGYYRRDEKNAEYLERYNDEFPDEDRIQNELDHAFAFIYSCEFNGDSRAWKQTDLFTLIVEIHSALVVRKLPLDPRAVGRKLIAFYDQVNGLFKGKRIPDEGEIPTGQEQVFKYLKAATRATNDKYARMERAEVISELILTTVGDTSPPQPAADAAPADGDEAASAGKERAKPKARERRATNTRQKPSK